MVRLRLESVYALTVDAVSLFVRIFMGWENLFTSICVGPKISTPIISPFLFRSKIRLSDIGSVSATFPLLILMYSALQLSSYSSEAKCF